MEIHEQSNITPQQYAQFMPKQRYYIPKPTVNRNKITITSLNSGIITNNFSNTRSTPYDWVINATNNCVFDLSQAYFNIAGNFKTTKQGLTTENFAFGNQFISSTFQTAQLNLGGATIARNAYPGLDANIQAMLKFDQYDLKNFSLADREFLINELSMNANISTSTETFPANAFNFTTEGKAGEAATKATGTNGSAGKTALLPWKNKTFVYNGVGIDIGTTNTLDNCSLFTIRIDEDGTATLNFYNGTIGTNVSDNAAATGINNTALQFYVIDNKNDEINRVSRNPVIPSTNSSGFVINDGETYVKIPFRCKLYLSDLFNYTIDSLDYVFNRELKITLQRSASDFVICNVAGPGTVASDVLEIDSISKFELIAYSYLLTDTAKAQLLKFYSQPIETLFGSQVMNVTPLYTNTSQAEQQITLPLTVNYDTKALILAFPKCSNCLVPLSTSPEKSIPGQIPSSTNKDIFQYSWLYSNSNSLNYCGLRHIRISNSSNSNIYTYDFAGTRFEYKNPDPILKSFDYSNSADNAKAVNNDYRETYEQYKQLRILFGKSPDNAIDYYTYLKDYFIIPIDLTGTNIPPNTRFYVTFQFEPFDPSNGRYNPLYYGNNKQSEKQLTTNLLSISLGSNVLLYQPDGTCIVKNILSANPQDKQVGLNNM